jgi:hypothetical protein
MSSATALITMAERMAFLLKLTARPGLSEVKLPVYANFGIQPS